MNRLLAAAFVAVVLSAAACAKDASPPDAAGNARGVIAATDSTEIPLLSSTSQTRSAPSRRNETTPSPTARSSGGPTLEPQSSPISQASLADGVRIKGVQYVSYEDQFIDTQHVGPLLGVTTRRLADSSAASQDQTTDGLASFLRPGTEVHALKASRTTTRVAARTPEGWKVYENYWVADAQTGADQLDIDGKVTRIDVLSELDGRTVIGSITDDAAVRDLVAQVLAGRVTSPPSDRIPESFVGFRMTDGTTIQRQFYGKHRLVGDITVPQAFITAIVAAR